MGDGCLKVIAGGILLGILYCVCAVILMWAWNLFLPLFGVFEITYAQAMGAVILLTLIGGLLK